MKKHTKVCRANEGITSCFDNGEIISFQDNFKYLGDVPFTVYFDFEATTDNTAFFWAKDVCDGLLSDEKFFSSELRPWKNCDFQEFSTKRWRNLWPQLF